jgi:hypothetical protein
LAQLGEHQERGLVAFPACLGLRQSSPSKRTMNLSKKS